MRMLPGLRANVARPATTTLGLPLGLLPLRGEQRPHAPHTTVVEPASSAATPAATTTVAAEVEYVAPTDLALDRVGVSWTQSRRPL